MAIVVTSSLIPGIDNTPLDVRTRVATKSLLSSILMPYIGMHVYIESLSNLVVVTKLRLDLSAAVPVYVIDLTKYLSGLPGVSPLVLTLVIEGGTKVVITDAQGSHSFDVYDGLSAGFGTTLVSTVTLPAGETAYVLISSSGPDTAKNFKYRFGIPKGVPGGLLAVIQQATLPTEYDPDTLYLITGV